MRRAGYFLLAEDSLCGLWVPNESVSRIVGIAARAIVPSMTARHVANKKIACNVSLADIRLEGEEMSGKFRNNDPREPARAAASGISADDGEGRQRRRSRRGRHDFLITGQDRVSGANHPSGLIMILHIDASQQAGGVVSIHPFVQAAVPGHGQGE